MLRRKRGWKKRFPQFLALNLLKCSHGSQPALNAARGWLIKNLRIEQRHAEWYRDWAECAGILQKTLFEGHIPAAMTAITDWCWHICESGSLVEGLAATNFAIEGVTGDWSEKV
jgi:pyrroloquinoline quinone (PQQ) biosynthesis protein C